MDQWMNRSMDGEVSIGIAVHTQERPLHSTADSLFLGPLPLTAWPRLLLPVVSSSLQLQGAQILIRHVF